MARLSLVSSNPTAGVLDTSPSIPPVGLREPGGLREDNSEWPAVSVFHHFFDDTSFNSCSSFFIPAAIAEAA